MSSGKTTDCQDGENDMDEDTPGRARVADTPELQRYYRELAALETGALWTVANQIEPWQPRSNSVPVLWRYSDLRGLVLRSVELVTPERAGRRVVYLNNPGRRAVSAVVGWLYSGLQVMRPGEIASAHSHSAAALRFIMEGSGAYTVVDGHKITLGARDVVLTPNGTWHEHGVEPGGTPCIWQDALDIPFVNAMEANFFVVHPELHQSVAHSPNDTSAYWGNPGLKPANAEWSHKYSPLFKYEWGPTYEALCRYGAASEGSAFDGTLMDYVNPITGGPVMPTLGASMQQLRPGEATRAHRHTGSVVYQVALGSGHSVIGGVRFDWNERDIFCVPSWTWHEHANGSERADACLFSFHDLPVIRTLGLYREEAFGGPAGRQPVVSRQLDRGVDTCA